MARLDLASLRRGRLWGRHTSMLAQRLAGVDPQASVRLSLPILLSSPPIPPTPVDRNLISRFRGLSISFTSSNPTPLRYLSKPPSTALAGHSLSLLNLSHLPAIFNLQPLGLFYSLEYSYSIRPLPDDRFDAESAFVATARSQSVAATACSFRPVHREPFKIPK